MVHEARNCFLTLCSLNTLNMGIVLDQVTKDKLQQVLRDFELNDDVDKVSCKSSADRGKFDNAVLIMSQS